MVLVGVSLGMEYTSPQEGEAGAAVHRAFEHFESADLAFDGACGPRQAERRLDSADVLVQFGDERPQHGGACRIQNMGEHLLTFAPEQQSKLLGGSNGISQSWHLRQEAGDEGGVGRVGADISRQ